MVKQKRSYISGKLIDAATNTFPQEFIKAAEYADIDEAGIPWTLVVAVDRKTYESFTLVNSFYVTVSPATYIGMYQIFCGVPGDEVGRPCDCERCRYRRGYFRTRLSHP